VRRLGPRRGLLLTGTVVAGAAALLGAAWVSGLLFADTARPAAAGSALERFRATDPRPRGIDGVYAYRTSGSESLDVLGGVTHRYPAVTTITVVETSCGVRLRWDALAGRSTTWTLCTRSGGVELRGLDEVHRFFGHTDRTRYACAKGGGEGLSCRGANGTETGQESVVGQAGVEVGGVRVRALHVRMTARVAGGSSGTETTEWWLQPGTGLPLKLVVSSRTSRPEPVVGQAHYRENATLRLVSTAPQR
jgi:hypothetical protein